MPRYVETDTRAHGNLCRGDYGGGEGKGKKDKEEYCGPLAWEEEALRFHQVLSARLISETKHYSVPPKEPRHRSPGSTA
ncbi:unnamed protein product [Rhizoctonia solani]|uniref:Uncharacterized protein n=1 Tax=Rhizoctonia solani TaxID=456999 RepID=A0A8H2WQW2_9AGAM|nr:unnamed protein product [Rhizoctonia solani]